MNSQHVTLAVQDLHNVWQNYLKCTAINLVAQRGRSVTSVATELRIRSSTLVSWLRSAGVSLAGRPRPNVKVSHEARAKAVERVVGGQNATQVAESLGVTAAAVYQWVRAAVVTKPRNINKSNATRYTAEFKREAVRQVVEQGRSVQTVSVERGISHQTLRNWLKSAAAA